MKLSCLFGIRDIYIILMSVLQIVARTGTNVLHKRFMLLRWKMY